MEPARPYATYHYDRDRSPRYPDAQNTLGQISYIEDPAGATYYSYDARGNTIATARHFAQENLDFVTRMAYDASDRIVQLTYPDGMTVPFTYDPQGQLAQVPGYVDQIDYTAAGQRANIAYANGVTTDYEYDQRLRLQRLQSSNRQRSTLQDLTYTFDSTSNILNIADSRPDRIADNDQTQAYLYDNLYRLTQAAGTYGQIDYGYNSIHNMVHKSSTASDSRLNLGALGYGPTATDPDAGPHALTAAAGESYVYDANGNRTTKGDTTYQWDPHNQLIATDDGQLAASYLYDSAGQRARQTVTANGVTTTTLYVGQYAEVRGADYVQYVFADRGRIAELKTPFDPGQLIRGFNGNSSQAATAKKRWYLADHLGGTSLLLDDSGQIVSESVYYPYGLTRYEQRGDEVAYRFTGKELDETGLYYFGARYYDPGVGVWLSTDPIFEAYLDNGSKNKAGIVPLDLSLYSYSYSNPMKYYDPDGNSPRQGINDFNNQGLTFYNVNSGGSYHETNASNTSNTWFVNGIRNGSSKALKTGRSQVGNQPFTLLHNASSGLLADLTESALDKLSGFLGTRPSRSARHLADMLIQERHRKIHLHAHSQGGIIVTRALELVAKRGVKLDNLTVSYHGAAIHKHTAYKAVRGVNAHPASFEANPYDPVPMIVGGNGNPVNMVRSVVGFFQMIIPGGKDPHAYPKSK